MASVESFFDLRIATIDPGETPPREAHVARMVDPDRAPGEGWFDVPSKILYIGPVRRPRTAEERRKIRALERKVEARYRLVEDPGLARFAEFHALYRRTVVGLPRGVDRIESRERIGDPWFGLYLLEGEVMIAGILVQRLRGHYSVSFGAFDPAHGRKIDLEHYLILEAAERAAAKGHAEMSLGVDTNRYGHHLSLGLPAYKWRIGFQAQPYRLGGREFIRPLRFEPFAKGLFFYAFGEGGLVGQLFTAGAADRSWKHRLAPPITVHPMTPGE